VGFVVDKVTLGQVFSPSSSVFLCQFHSTGAPLLGKGQKIIIIIIFTGLHGKPEACGESVASGAGPFSSKKKTTYNKSNTANLAKSASYPIRSNSAENKIAFCIS
jgi:hypothetical protein